MNQIEEYLKSGISFVPAVVCYLKRGNQVLLGLRKKVSFGFGGNLIAGIGGKVGDFPEFEGETHEEALVREVYEEIGVKVTKFRKMGRVRFIFQDKPNWNQDVYVYVVDVWEGDPRETDAIKPMWFEIDNLPVAQMWDDNQYWMYKVLSGEYVDGVFLFDKDTKVMEHLFE